MPMGTPLDQFRNNPLFGVMSLTAALNRMPFTPNLISSLGLFDPRPGYTDSVQIEYRDGALSLVPSRPRGAPPSVDTGTTRGMILMAIPHFPVDATIMADSILGVRAFGSNDQLEAIDDVVQGRLTRLGMRLDVTQEWLRLGAVRGEVVTRVDPTTGTPLETVSLFSAFGVSPIGTQTWPVLPPSGGWTEDHAWQGVVMQLCLDMQRMIAAERGMGTVQQIYAICGSQFFGGIASIPEIRQIMLNTAAAQSLAGPAFGSRVTYQGITFIEYLGTIGNTPFVAADEAHFFPGPSPDLWVEAYAPANYIETVNTLALPRYAKQEVMDFGVGVMLQAQMNVLPICTRPRTLIKATATQAT